MRIKHLCVVFIFVLMACSRQDDFSTYTEIIIKPNSQGHSFFDESTEANNMSGTLDREMNQQQDRSYKMIWDQLEGWKEYAGTGMRLGTLIKIKDGER